MNRYPYVRIQQEPLQTQATCCHGLCGDGVACPMSEADEARICEAMRDETPQEMADRVGRHLQDRLRHANAERLRNALAEARDAEVEDELHRRHVNRRALWDVVALVVIAAGIVMAIANLVLLP